MTDAEITINDQTESGTTANVDTESLTVGSKTVQRQRVQLAGATSAQIASIINSAPVSEYGIVTRNIPSGTQTISGAITNTNLDTAISTRASEATLAIMSGNIIESEALLTLMNAKSPALGQAVMASSIPITIASNQSALSVSVSSDRGLGFTKVNSTLIGDVLEATIIPAVASEYHDVFGVILSNGAGPAMVQIRDTTGGAVLLNVYVGATSTVVVNIPAKLAQAAANTNWTVQAGTAGMALFALMFYTKHAA